jgi:hypothetical protein
MSTQTKAESAGHLRADCGKRLLSLAALQFFVDSEALVKKVVKGQILLEILPPSKTSKRQDFE